MPSPEPMPLSFGRLLREQIRATGFALTREAMMAGAALTLVCVIILSIALRENEQLNFQPELLMPTLFVVAYFPFALWKDDAPFGQPFLWRVPVRHQQAALAKIMAGAMWLMAAMLATAGALALVALLTGGGLGDTRTRLLDTGSGEVSAAVEVAWSVPWWMWVMPFVNALTIYLAISAAILGLRYPVRIVAGVGAAVLLVLGMLVSLGDDTPIRLAVLDMLETLRSGRLGLDFALTGGETSLFEYIRRPDGPGYVRIWSEMPSIGRWALAAFFWLGVALAALGLAIRRHWER